MSDADITTLAPDVSTTPLDTPTVDYAALLEAEKAKNARLKADLDKHRTRADAVEAERLKNATIEEQLAALKQQADDALKRAEAAEAARKHAQLLAAFAGKAVDPEAAVRLLDDNDFDDDGNVKVDAFFKRRPYLATAPTGVTPTRGAGSSAPGGKNAQLTALRAQRDAAPTRLERIALDARIQQLSKE
jgi:hypothetical protein